MFQRVIATAVVVAFLAGMPGAQELSTDAARQKEIEAAYAQLNAANEAGDLERVVGMKTADFHAIFPDGRVGDAETMKEYSRRFMQNNRLELKIRITIEKLTVSEHGTIAVADVLQMASRKRELAGKVRLLETSVRQRETWSKTAVGWKLKSVDNVHDQATRVDGKPVDPSKPYDPDAPPFVPK